MYIDTHCHLFKEYYDNIDLIVENAKKQKVSKIIVSGCDINSNFEVLKLIDKYDIVYGTLGFQPTELEYYKEDDLIWLKNSLKNKKVVAIGEIGLDYHYEDTNKELQKYVFRKQLEIAAEYNKPVVVHSRDSIQDTYNILKEYNIKGVIHCYSGSPEMAKKFIEIGFCLGIGGILTYKNANNIIKVIKEVPIEYIVLETDAPFLTPEPYRNKKNEPAYIPIIAKKVAQVTQKDVNIIESITNNNAVRIFDF